MQYLPQGGKKPRSARTHAHKKCTIVAGNFCSATQFFQQSFIGVKPYKLLGLTNCQSKKLEAENLLLYHFHYYTRHARLSYLIMWSHLLFPVPVFNSFPTDILNWEHHF